MGGQTCGGLQPFSVASKNLLGGGGKVLGPQDAGAAIERVAPGP